MFERFAAALAAVHAIPELPITNSFVKVEPAPRSDAEFKDAMGLLAAMSCVWLSEVGPGTSLVKLELLTRSSKPRSFFSLGTVAPHTHSAFTIMQPPAGLTCTQATQLQAWLPPGGTTHPSEWRDMYRGSRDGFGAADFHRCCDGQPRLLVLVRVRDGGELFGGFTAAGFNLPEGYKTDRTSYLYSLDNALGRPEKLKNKKTGFGMDLLYSPLCSASFGDGAGLHVCDNADTVAGSTTNTGYSYAESASMGDHPIKRGTKGGWLAAEVVAWAV